MQLVEPALDHKYIEMVARHGKIKRVINIGVTEGQGDTDTSSLRQNDVARNLSARQ